MVCQKWLQLCPSFFLAYFWQSRWCDNDWLLIRCFRIHRDYLVANSRVHFFLTCIIYYVEAQSRESAAPIFVILIWKVMQKPQECHACWCLFHRLFPSTYTTTISSWFHPPISFNGNRTVRSTHTTWTVKNIYIWRIIWNSTIYSPSLSDFFFWLRWHSVICFGLLPTTPAVLSRPGFKQK